MKKLFNRRVVLLLLVCLVAFGAWRYFKPIPLAVVEANQPIVPLHLQSVQLPWPKYGHAAIGAEGRGVLETSAQTRPGPIASVAKVMTALAVLDKKPLPSGQDGPNITITAEDVAAYKEALKQGQSVLPVKEGEQLSERQALEALLIPSANNIATVLANWAFGSTDNYLIYAKQKAKILAMNDSTFADASGYSPKTTSTAHDLVLLGLATLNDPTIKQIVGKTDAKFPIAGKLKNYNALVGSDGVVGIKTGNTDEAGGVYLLAANRNISGKPVTTVVAVMNEPDLATAIMSARAILLASDGGFYDDSEEVVGTYQTDWGAQSKTSKKTVSALVWGGKPAKVILNFDKLPAGSPKGAYSGTATISNGSFSKTQNLYLAEEIPEPSFWWRILR